MTTRLTLRVDKRVVQKAKRFAQTQKKSLSEIVTSYLDNISGPDIEVEEINPEVFQASAEISPDRIPAVKETRYRYLEEKHLNG